jgi:hypothetical protein
MKVYIVHDEAGEIRSVVQVEAATAPSDAPVPVLGAAEGDIVTEVPAEGVPADVGPLEVHENYRFDVKRGKLVRKSRSARKAKPDGQDE